MILSTGGGHAWLPGVCGCRGMCMVVGGHVWLQRVCMVVGVIHGCGGHAWFWGGMRGCRGACMVVGGVHGGGGHAWWRGGASCVGYDEIQSMSGRYASYWNAFLF